MLRAVIFDFDGVLVNSESLHFSTLKEALDGAGAALTEHVYQERYLALDDKGAFSAFFADQGVRIDQEQLQGYLQKKAALFKERIRRGEVMIYPGVREVIDTLSHRYLLAVATGSRRDEVETILRSAGLRLPFMVVVSADDVKKGKPDPESYCRALAGINLAAKQGPAVQPSECVVIEDSRQGIVSARAAGMKCVAVATSYQACDLQEADLVLQNLAALNIAQLEELFRSWAAAGTVG